MWSKRKKGSLNQYVYYLDIDPLKVTEIDDCMIDFMERHPKLRVKSWTIEFETERSNVSSLHVDAEFVPILVATIGEPSEGKFAKKTRKK